VKNFKEDLYVYNFKHQELKLALGLKLTAFPKFEYFCDFPKHENSEK